jgi:quercetin dioxygenase-like cupin family protein
VPGRDFTPHPTYNGLEVATAGESGTERRIIVSADRANQSATHIPLGEGKSLWLITDLHTFKAVGEDTNGGFSLTELTVQPQFGPPPHIHHREDESFYILEGEFEFLYEDSTFVAGPGSFVYLPKGRLHMHRAAGDAPAKALVLVTPAGVEKFIEEAGEPAIDKSSPPAPPELSEIERIVAIAQKYGIEVPPPPAQ